MCRGFLASCRYSVSCWSERCRPNHVFHQNRNGIRTINQPVAKKRIFWVRDMERLGLGSPVSFVAVCSLLVIESSYLDDRKQRCTASCLRWNSCRRGRRKGSGCPSCRHGCHP